MIKGNKMNMKTIIFESKKYDVPIWVNYVARDKSSEVYGYEFKPERDDIQWHLVSKDYTGRYFAILEASEAWKDSVVKV